MVVVVAAVLSSAATFLKPMQQRNQAIDKMQSILEAAGKQDIAVEDAIEVFNANITNMMVIDQDGNVWMIIQVMKSKIVRLLIST